MPRRSRTTSGLHFDSYTLKARLAPGLAVLTPLVAVSLAWFPELVSLPGLSLLTVVAIGAGMIIAFQVRRGGQEIQAELFERWGGAPTTLILRHADPTISANEKQRYHQLLASLVAGVSMPSATAEIKNPKSADEVYETVIDWLRERTRDSAKFPVVASENANYGFHRNLFALRMHGLVAAGVSVAGALTLLAFGMSWGAAAALLIGCVTALVFWSQATEARVRDAGFLYAVALVRAVNAL